MISKAADLSHVNHPPTKSTDDPKHQVLQATTGAAAASFDWAGTLGADAPTDWCWIHVQAVTTPAFVRFGSASTTASTAATGMHIAAGEGCYLWVHPVKHRYIDHISTGAGSLKVRVSTP